MMQMKKIPVIDLKRQHESIRKELLATFEEALNESTFIKGKPIKQFEEAFAKYCSTKYACAVSNGTSAISLALEACGIGQGDEVILPAFTFFATAEMVLRVGAIPRFADIDERTFVITPKTVEAAITNKTKAIIAVHIYGQMCDMSGLQALAKKKNLVLIEDAAQAHGALWEGKSIGTFSDAGTFSFYPAKNLGALGDAGAVATNREDVALKVRMLADHGRKEGDRYVYRQAGYNERMDTLQAKFLLTKLRHIETWTKRRQEIAQKYDKAFANVLWIPQKDPKAHHVYHLYVIQTPKRDQLCTHLNSKGIDCSVEGTAYVIPLHKQEALMHEEYSKIHLPITEAVGKRILCLPTYPELTDEEVQYIIDAVLSFFK